MGRRLIALALAALLLPGPAAAYLIPGQAVVDNLGLRFTAPAGTSTPSCGANEHIIYLDGDEARLMRCENGDRVGFTIGLQGTLDVRDYGAACNGSDDDATAIGLMIADAPTAGAQVNMCVPMRAGAVSVTKPMHFSFPCGTVTLTDAWTYSTVSGAFFGGCGSGTSSTAATNLVWAGDDMGAAFVLQDVARSRWERFRLVASTSVPLHTAFFSENASATSTVTPRENVFEDLFVEGTNGGITFGWDLSQPANASCTAEGVPWYCCTGNGTGTCTTGVDNNNDNFKWHNVRVSNYVTAGWRFHSSGDQQVGHEFYGCHASAGTGDHVLMMEAGSFKWFGGQWSNADVSAFYIGTPSQEMMIVGGNGEGDERLLTTGGPTSTRSPVTIAYTRWSASGINADGIAIEFRLGGPLLLIGNRLGIQTVAVTFRLSGNATGFTPVPVGIAQGNFILSTSTAPFTTLHTTDERWTLMQNQQRTDTNAFAAIPDVTAWQPTLQADLPAEANGALRYCSDCTFANPCAGSGTGAFAKRLNGAWRCD